MSANGSQVEIAAGQERPSEAGTPRPADPAPIRPIFLLSNPRSGSTLVQRVIAAHPRVATTSEPWLLLPHIYTMRGRGVMAEYPFEMMLNALEDFCTTLPGGQRDYARELHDFAIRLYRRAAGPDAHYFLDKTPHYSLIAEELLSLFPDGRFVFLWRDPLSVVSSLVETWPANRGQWNPAAYREHLFVGLPRLVKAYGANRERSHAVRFEDLAGGDIGQWRSLMAYLGIEFDPETLEGFASVRLQGRLGDPTGVKRYASLTSEPIEKWRATIHNPLRKQWCRRYLRFLGDERLAAMGYDRAELEAALDRQPSGTRLLWADLAHLVNEVVKEPVRVHGCPREIRGPSVLRELLRGQPQERYGRFRPAGPR